MKTQKTIKSLNAAKIIAAKNAETNGDDFVSNVGGEEIIWNFRKTKISDVPVSAMSKTLIVL